ncbi:PIG-L deacetylase family protein [Oscillospiraceae bacterium WX1]
MRILVIAAHPDDEVLGCGGYMARLSESNEVFTAIVTEGCSAQYADTDYKKIIALKKMAALKANSLLGVRDVFFGDFPDMRLDTVGHVTINAFLEKVIAETSPRLVLTHHPGDLNLDHQLVYRSTMVAARPVHGHPIDILLYETPSATEWQGYDYKTAFIPTVFIDIDETIARKIEALAQYDIELRSAPHPRSEHGICAHASYRGLAAGLMYAEAFSLQRSVEFGISP